MNVKNRKMELYEDNARNVFYMFYYFYDYVDHSSRRLKCQQSSDIYRLLQSQLVTPLRKNLSINVKISSQKGLFKGNNGNGCVLLQI